MGFQLMRTLYDPVTIISVGAGLLGGFAQASAARSAAESEAAMLEMQAEQERKQRARDLSDLKIEKRQTLARTVAVLAAQGADSADPQSRAILKSQAGTFGTREARLKDDSTVRERSFETKASNVRSTGGQEATAQIFGGIARAGPLFRGAPKTGKKK